MTSYQQLSILSGALQNITNMINDHSGVRPVQNSDHYEAVWNIAAVLEDNDELGISRPRDSETAALRLFSLLKASSYLTSAMMKLVTEQPGMGFDLTEAIAFL